MVQFSFFSAIDDAEQRHIVKMPNDVPKIVPIMNNIMHIPPFEIFSEIHWLYYEIIVLK